MRNTLLLPALLASISQLALSTPLFSPSLGNRQQPQQAGLNFTDYLYVYFTGERLPQGEQVYAAVSSNNSPKSWTTLNQGQPILTSSLGTGGIRDPSLIISPDRSKFYMIATDLKVYGLGWNNGTCYTCNGSKSIIVWESSDLVSWTGPFSRRVSPPEAGMTWAPDAIWDFEREKYMAYWTSKIDGNLVIFRAFTEDFVSFTPAEKYVTYGMDATIVYDEDTKRYYWISKNGPDELIQQRVSTTGVNGPWTLVSERIGLGEMPAGEGPLIFRDNLDRGKWHLWIDDYMRGDGGYLPFETTDLAKGEWALSKDVKLPKNARHGYVVPM
ncbi:glycosyl hydrolase [Podospora australis]|uniref:Glycosyl hydrolase n=1 Tax=Podospora australis TaxID=1536484 RepID=A0AAN7ACC9_9PEZI|nr:glycosyl hydrolase [Podospora australis]